MSSSSRSAPAAAASWQDMVVISAATSWDGVFGTGKHMAIQLSRYRPVLYVDPPMSVLTPVRKPYLRDSLRAPRLRLVRPGLARLTPVAPPGVGRTLLRDVAAVATRRAISRAVAELGGPVHALVAIGFQNVFGACDARLNVLYGTDDFVAGGVLTHTSQRWLVAREAAQLRGADRIIAVSPSLADRWETRGHEVALVTNGCDASAYASTSTAPVPRDVSVPAPIAVFVGHLSDRIELRLLEAVADTGHSVLLVGPRQADFATSRVDDLFARPNVQWVGRKPFEDLPSYLRVAKVGITPYADSAFNRGSFPLKTLEYLAAGRAAVVSDLPSARWIRSEHITIADGPAAFAEATATALVAEESPEAAEGRREVARRNSWDIRGQQFAEAIDIEVNSTA